MAIHGRITCALTLVSLISFSAISSHATVEAEAVPGEYESLDAFGVMMIGSISVTLSADATAIAPDEIAGVLLV